MSQLSQTSITEKFRQQTQRLLNMTEGEKSFKSVNSRESFPKKPQDVDLALEVKKKVLTQSPSPPRNSQKSPKLLKKQIQIPDQGKLFSGATSPNNMSYLESKNEIPRNIPSKVESISIKERSPIRLAQIDISSGAFYLNQANQSPVFNPKDASNLSSINNSYLSDKYTMIR